MSVQPPVTPQLILASQSPRRADMLRQMRLLFTAVSPDIDERVIAAESAKDYVERLSLAKAQAGLELCPALALPALGSDTAVVINGEILGKPADEADAIAMLSKLSGQTHQVWTGVAVADAQQRYVTSVCSQVTFAHLSLRQMQRYWQTGEPQDKAGSYAIQGLGGAFVRNMEGSYSGIVGLPIYETLQLLARFGITVL